MGNCIETCMNGEEEVDRKEEHKHDDDQEEGCFVEESSGFDDEKRKVRIKVVLTKEELEWLVFQLEDKNGKSLEDALAEIERCRGKLGQTDDNSRGKVVSNWKPDLESIMESPEVFEMDR